MRQITELATKALLNGYTFKRGNTEVTKAKELKLFGHVIARYGAFTGCLELNDCGHQTVTTKERLNGILSMLNAPTIYQKNFTWYYNRKDGERRLFNDDKQSNGYISVDYMRGNTDENI